METLDRIKDFISKGYYDGAGNGKGFGKGFGDGSGYGNGFGNSKGFDDGSGYGNGNSKGYYDGYGYGYGYGYGAGAGAGDGYGDGYGNGYGYGKGIRVFNGIPVHLIDGVPTLIHTLHGNIAQCSVLADDLTLNPCYMAKVDGFFAHGDTAHEAFLEAQDKAFRGKPVEERVAEFIEAFPDRSAKYPAEDFFRWHNLLTGSCSFGRRQFCAQHGIDTAADTFTVDEFISLTVDSYGGDVIARLRKELEKGGNK